MPAPDDSPARSQSAAGDEQREDRKGVEQPLDRDRRERGAEVHALAHVEEIRPDEFRQPASAQSRSAVMPIIVTATTPRSDTWRDGSSSARHRSAETISDARRMRTAAGEQRPSDGSEAVDERLPLGIAEEQPQEDACRRIAGEDSARRDRAVRMPTGGSRRRGGAEPGEQIRDR